MKYPKRAVLLALLVFLTFESGGFTLGQRKGPNAKRIDNNGPFKCSSTSLSWLDEIFDNKCKKPVTLILILTTNIRPHKTKTVIRKKGRKSYGKNVLIFSTVYMIYITQNVRDNNSKTDQIR